MPFKPFARVRWSVCTLSLLLLALSWGYFGLSFRRDYQTLEERASQRVQDIALGLEVYARRLFQKHDLVLLDLADQLLADNSAQQLQPLCAGWLNRLQQLHLLRIVDARSSVILLETDDGSGDYLETIAYPLVDLQPGTYSPLRIAGNQHQHQVDTNQVVLWRQLNTGSRQYLLIALLQLDDFQDYYQTLELSAQGEIAILHNSGEILAHEPLGAEFSDRVKRDVAKFFPQLQPGKAEASWLSDSADGTKRLIAYRQLLGSPLVVSVGDSTKLIFADWQHRLREIFIIQLAISLAILLATYLLVRSLSTIEQAEARLHERERHFRSVADSTVDAVISVDAEQRVQFWSRGAERTFEVSSAAAQGQLLSNYLQFNGELGLQQTLDQLAVLGASEQSGGTFEVQGVRSNRWIFPTELSVSTGTSAGKPFFTLIVRDVTDRKALEEYIRRLASHDNLTRLPNRRLLMDRLQVAMAQVRRQGGQFALLFLDLDEFKPVNDGHGHEIGDLLLQQVAERLEASVRESDTVARVGGDEFAMLLTNIDETETVRVVCENILKALNREFVLQQKSCRIGGSIGAVLYTGQELTGSELIGMADMAMYTAKKAGKNRYVLVPVEDDFTADNG